MPNDINTAFVIPSAGAGFSAFTKVTGPIPTPRAHEVLVRIRAVSLNFRDVAIVRGLYPTPTKRNLVPCQDMAGEVVQAGEGCVADWKAGDRVTAYFVEGDLYGRKMRQDVLGGSVDGVLQQYRVFQESTLLRVPKHLTYEEAASLPCTGVTAWNSLFGGKPLLPGQTVLLTGTGGVSMITLILANAMGAKTIITSSSDAKLELAKNVGATHTINYKTHADWDKVVLELTDGEGAHHIIDNVGVNDFEKYMNCVAYEGTVDCIGFLGGAPAAAPNIPLSAILKGANVRGILAGYKEQMSDMLRFVETKSLRPHIDKVFAFEDAVKALEYLASGQHFGKVIVKVD